MSDEKMAIEDVRAVVAMGRRMFSSEEPRGMVVSNEMGVTMAQVAAAASENAARMEARQHAVLDQLVSVEMSANPDLKRTPAEAKVKAGSTYITYRETKAEYEALATEAHALSRYFFNRARMLAQEPVHA